MDNQSRDITLKEREAHVRELEFNHKIGFKRDGGKHVDFTTCKLANWLAAGNHKFWKIDKNGQVRYVGPET